MEREKRDAGRPTHTYAESQDRQQEFEELVREEGDWEEAAKDERRGEKPRRNPPAPSSA